MSCEDGDTPARRHLQQPATTTFVCTFFVYSGPDWLLLHWSIARRSYFPIYIAVATGLCYRIWTGKVCHHKQPEGAQHIENNGDPIMQISACRRSHSKSCQCFSQPTFSHYQFNNFCQYFPPNFGRPRQCNLFLSGTAISLIVTHLSVSAPVVTMPQPKRPSCLVLPSHQDPCRFPFSRHISSVAILSTLFATRIAIFSASRMCSRKMYYTKSPVLFRCSVHTTNLIFRRNFFIANCPLIHCVATLLSCCSSIVGLPLCSCVHIGQTTGTQHLAECSGCFRTEWKEMCRM